MSQTLSGLADASLLFLLAAGLTHTVGVTRIVNFGHGAIAMLAAYLASVALRWLPDGPAQLLFVIIAVSIAAGLLGFGLQFGLFRRLYGTPVLLQCLATLAVSLIAGGTVLALWGPSDQPVPPHAWLSDRWEIAGLTLSSVDLLRVAIGVAAAVILISIRLPLRRSSAPAAFALGAGLAGLAGALVTLDTPASPGLDLRLLAQAFAVVAIGGLGSIRGAAVAAVLIGLFQAFGAVLLPDATILFAFLAMGVVLAIRPGGLLGRHADLPLPPEQVLTIRPTPRSARLLGIVVLLLAAAAPFLVGPFALDILAQTLVVVLFATGLHVIVGPGGMPSFAHAAFLGIGAYAAALVARDGGVETGLALVAAPLAAGVAALLFGTLTVRLSRAGIAMLTLVFTETVWTVATHADRWFGTGTAIGGLQLSAWARTPAYLYWLSLGLLLATIVLMRRLLAAPFGYTLRAARDDPRRAAANGLPVQAVRLAAFTVGGAVAGLAGGLLAFSAGGAAPSDLAAGTSVDGLLMLLIGGAQALAGPIVGAIAYTGLTEIVPPLAGAGRAVLGLGVIALVLFLPEGIAGAFYRSWRRGV